MTNKKIKLYLVMWLLSELIPEAVDAIESCDPYAEELDIEESEDPTIEHCVPELIGDDEETLEAQVLYTKECEKGLLRDIAETINIVKLPMEFNREALEEMIAKANSVEIIAAKQTLRWK